MVNRNIKDEIACFYTVIKNINIKDSIKQSRIKENKIFVDEIIYDNFDVNKQIAEQSLLVWIKLIENENLHKDMKSLSIEEQIFISYIFNSGKT